MKQIVKQMEHSVVKNPNWYEANQLAILQVWPRIWTQGYGEQLGLGRVTLSTLYSAMLPPHFDFDGGLHRSFSDISHYHQQSYK